MKARIDDHLRQCPFCGSIVRLDNNINITFILCDKCGLAASFRHKEEMNMAINAWNTRAGETK